MQTFNSIIEVDRYIENVGQKNIWVKENFPCSNCHVNVWEPKIKIPKGRICLSCVVDHLKKKLKAKSVRSLTPAQILSSLKPESPILSRLTVLYQAKNIYYHIFENASDSTKNIFFTSLVKNLGYVSSHPLTPPARQAAFEACISLQDKILPYLLEVKNPQPWQFYANIVLTAGSIAPDNNSVKELITQAAQDENPNIRIKVLETIYDLDKNWAQTIFDNLSKDPNPLVKQAAIKIKQQPIRKSDYPKIKKQPAKKIMPVKYTRFESLISQLYTYDHLNKIYETYLYKFAAEFGLDSGNKNSLKKQRKAVLVKMLAEVFQDKEKFDRLSSDMPKKIKQIFLRLVWEKGSHSMFRLQKEFNIKLITYKKDTPSWRNESKISKYCYLFSIQTDYNYHYNNSHSQHYSIFLADDIRIQLKKHLAPPLEYEFIPLDSLPDGHMVFEDQGQIIRFLPLFYAYISQGNLEYSKTGERILVKSIRKMADYCNIKEYYNTSDNALDYIRTKLTADFLTTAHFDKVKGSAAYFKQLLNEFFLNKNFKSYASKELLYHIKGIGFDYQNTIQSENQIRSTLFQIFKKIPRSKWISIENIAKYIIFHELFIDAISRKYAGNYAYFQKEIDEDDSASYYPIKIYIHEDIYSDAIILPFIKAFMFLFAGLGIIDFAYDLPINTKMQVKDKPYLSIFDGLKYIRLTALGEFIMGRKKSCDIHFDEKPAKIILDENRLMIKLDRKDRMQSMTLKKIGTPVSPTCFRINYNSFLKDCDSKQDVLQKIKFFKKYISKNPPPLWKNFLDELLAKIDPIILDNKLIVFKIKQDKTLISIIAKDNFLKKYILKAEDYHIIIQNKHIPKVKKRLESFGYLIDQS